MNPLNPCMVSLMCEEYNSMDSQNVALQRFTGRISMCI